MTDHLIDDAAARLEAIGVKHSPMQLFEDGTVNTVDGRHITLRDARGVYYLLDSDNDGAARKPGVRLIQLMFLEVPEHAIHYVEQLGAEWRLDKVELLPAVEEGHPGVWSAILSHVV